MSDQGEDQLKKDAAAMGRVTAAFVAGYATMPRQSFDGPAGHVTVTELVAVAAKVELRASVLIALVRAGIHRDGRVLGQAARDLDDQLVEAKALYLLAFPGVRWPE